MASIQQAALAAADPEASVASVLRLGDERLHLGSRSVALSPEARLWILAMGKAAPAMSRATVRVLGDRITGGLATLARYGPAGLRQPRAEASPEIIRLIGADHPIPGPGSVRAGEAAAELLSSARAEDVLLALISGGGSALIELPVEGVRLEEMQELNHLLLASGAPIQEVNLVRKALSRIKAGGLARLAAPARTAALILSDVVGDGLASVASGPTVFHRVPARQARAVLQRYAIWQRAPSSIRRALEAERRAVARAPRPINLLVGSNRQVVQAACSRAMKIGFRPRVLSHQMRGEASQVGLRFARRLRHSPPDSCLLMGGETTVTLERSGLGGRNQELALAAAISLDGAEGCALLALGTDGVDGPTDAAGALITGQTAGLMRARGMDPAIALDGHDSYPALDAVGALIRTGPTGTNLNDLVVGLRYRP